MSLELGKLMDFVNCAVDEAVFIAQKVGYPFAEGGKTTAFPHELLQMLEDAKTHKAVSFNVSVPEDITGEPWIRPFSVERLPA